jgi:hypothetical protein
MAVKQPFNSQQLEWNPRFGQIYNGRLIKAQMRIDSEVLKHCSKRVPFDSGTLHASGILNTILGSGLIVYKTPYARRMYYHPEYNFQGAPMRGGMWFERMKADVGNVILKMAGLTMGGKE